MSRRPDQEDSPEALPVHLQSALEQLVTYLDMEQKTEAGSHFFRRFGLQTSTFKRLRGWGLVTYHLDGHGPHTGVTEKGRAFIAVWETQRQLAGERVALWGARTGRTSCAKPNISNIRRGR